MDAAIRIQQVMPRQEAGFTFRGGQMEDISQAAFFFATRRRSNCASSIISCPGVRAES